MAPKRTTLSSFLAAHAAINIELNKMIMDPVEFQVYMTQFKTITIDSSNYSQSFVKLFHHCSNGSNDIQMKVFGSNIMTMFNEQIDVYNFNKKIQLYSSKVTKIDKVPQTASSISINQRFTFELKNYTQWVLNIDLVKTLSNPLEFKTKLKQAKVDLIDSPLEKMGIDAYDYVTTTLSYIGEKKLDTSDITEIVDEVTSMNNESMSTEYQDTIHSLAKDIFRDPIIISQFKRQSGFKRLVSKTVELSRPMYFKQVLTKIDTFYMTDKMDGLRAMLVIDEFYRRSGHRRIFLGAKIVAISDQVYTINNFQPEIKSKTIEMDHTVLDVEMMINPSGEKSFHCFDIISLISKKLSNLPFKARYAKFETVNTIMEKYELGKVKEFAKLSKEQYSTQIKNFYNKKREYHIDGLIFTPEGEFYKDAIKTRKSKFDRVFNTDYANTVSFKWKPLDQLSIDFYIMADPSKKKSYILCSGVDSNTFERFQMKFFDGYIPPISPNAHQFFPIQFEPYDGSFDYHWTPSKEELTKYNSGTFDNLVGEFVFADTNGYLSKPKLTRLRVDRINDIAKGEYYGNALRYAELIWHSIKFPLDINTMCEPVNKGYFASSDDDNWYKAQRNFNSFVKTYLLETYLYGHVKHNNTPTRIMDIACGKGQDLARAIDIGYDEIVAIDRDIDAIYELLERKYNLRVKRKGAITNIHIKQVDLEESADKNIKSICLPESTIDSATMNFAIHYLCHSTLPEMSNPLIEFVKFNKFNLKSGGRLLITSFIGEDIFNLLKNKDEWSLRESNQVKYSIKRQFSSDILTNADQSIGVLLPFSDGEHYSEYLVNYNYLQQLFEGDGFKMIKSDGFESLLRTYKKTNHKGFCELTEADKTYVSLYGFIVFEKL